MEDLAKELAAAAQALEEARRRRDELIVRASANGMSRRTVAAAVGLSAAGVQHVLSRDGHTADPRRARRRSRARR